MEKELMLIPALLILAGITLMTLGALGEGALLSILGIGLLAIPAVITEENEQKV